MEKNQRFVIRNATPSGKPIEEGVAALRQPIIEDDPERQYWLVEFVDEPCALFYRWVNARDRVERI